MIDSSGFPLINMRLGISIDACGDRWFTRWRGITYCIDFSKFQIPEVVLVSVSKYLRRKLLEVTPGIMVQVSLALGLLSDEWSPSWSDFSSISECDWRSLWLHAKGTRSETKVMTIRRIYKFCAAKKLAGANSLGEYLLDRLSASYERTKYQEVLNWDSEIGALVTAESELLRINVMREPEDETWDNCSLRLVIWSLIETVKRFGQIVAIPNDGLWNAAEDANGSDYFLLVPKWKYQSGRKPELWPISDALAEAIKKFGRMPGVAEKQALEGRLFVTSKASRFDDPRGWASSSIGRWIERRCLISPRTKQNMILTATRIRHSGATSLALRGASAKEIQYILEHDSESASYVYIDAIGSELRPLTEKVDNRLGGMFSSLNETFFKGVISESISGNEIFVPLGERPAVVGECSCSTVCTKHPFFSCYNGCKFFIAWKGGDHRRARDFVQSEYTRWNSVPGVHERSKVVSDFERVYQAIEDVIKIIKCEEDENHVSR